MLPAIARQVRELDGLHLRLKTNPGRIV